MDPNTITFRITINGKTRPVINLTPHPVTLYGKQSPQMIIPTHGTIRLTRDEDAETHTTAFSLTGHGENAEDVTRGPFTGKATHVSPWTGLHISGVPAELLDSPDSPVAILVSMPVAEFLVKSSRLTVCSVLVPDTGPGNVVRGAQGRILGVRSFVIHRE